MENPVSTILALIIGPLVLALFAGLLAWWRTPTAAALASPAAVLSPPDDLPPFERRGPIVVLALTTLLGLAGGAALAGQVNWQSLPTRAQEWLPYILVAAGLVGLMEAFLRPYWVIGWVLRLATLTAAIVLPVPPHIREAHSTFGISLLFTTMIALGALTWWGFDRASRARGPAGTLVVVMVCSLASLSFVLTGHVMPAIICGALAAAVGPGAIIGFLRPGFSLGPAVAAPAVGLAAYALHTHAVLGDTPRWCGGLLACSAGLGGLLFHAEMNPRRGPRATLLLLLLAALPALVSVAIGLARTISAGAAPAAPSGW
ncbi:MAG: hypothetical protein ACT4PL_11590 [Phycisphaerales bacterium]